MALNCFLKFLARGCALFFWTVESGTSGAVLTWTRAHFGPEGEGVLLTGMDNPPSVSGGTKEFGGLGCVSNFLDLIKKMLSYNPKNRITPAVALQHPFLILPGPLPKCSCCERSGKIMILKQRSGKIMILRQRSGKIMTLRQRSAKIMIFRQRSGKMMILRQRSGQLSQYLWGYFTESGRGK